MNESEFNRLMGLVPNSPYGTGYRRGLRRAFHGDSFGTEQEHETWLAREDSSGNGYRTGLAGEEPGKRGRPQSGAVPITVTVSPEHKARLLEIGNGNLSAGIRRAVDAFTSTAKP